MADHAKLSPSSSDRWLECPASLVRAPDVEDEGSEPAREGTAAHALGEHCLRTGEPAATAVFPKEHVKYDSAELRQYVQGYVDYVLRHQIDGELFVEQRLQIFPTFDVWGTADAVIVTPDGVLKVVDLKYGKGVLVEAEDNSQLTLYGIGALTLDWLSRVPVHTVEVHIYQPRRNNIVSKTYAVAELIEWFKANEHKVARAFAGTDLAFPGNHCKWCKVKGVCRERAEHNLALAAFDFASTEPACKQKSELSEDELVQIFLNLGNFKRWLEDIETEVAKRAHEHPVQGLKFVPGKFTRVIKDQTKAIQLLRAAGIEPLAEPKLLGITELEKRAKALELKIDAVLGDAVERVQGAPILVAESDKRVPFDRDAAAKQAFQNA